MRRSSTSAGAILALLLSDVALGSDPALQISVIAEFDQPIPGVGNITWIGNVAVNSLGSTLVGVGIDNPDQGRNSVLLLDSLPLYQEGDSLPAPAGSEIGTFNRVSLDSGGNVGWNFSLYGPHHSQDSGVFFNDTLLIQEGDTPTAPGFSAGTVYTNFFDCNINEQNETLVMAALEDPVIPGFDDRALILVDAVGNETVIVKEFDPAPGLPGNLILTLFHTEQDQFDLNDNGDVLFSADTNASGSEVIYLNSAIVAREGQPSPVSGRNWSRLFGSELSLNNQGDTVFCGTLDGDTATDSIIVLNGAKFMQERDSLPDIAPFWLTGFGNFPILVADRHDPADTDPDVLWYGEWNDPDTTRDSGLFLNDKLILHEGVDTINGLVIDAFRSYAMSPDGRYLVVPLDLAGNNTDVAILIDRGPWKNLGNGLAGSSTPRMRVSGSLEFNDPVTVCVTGALPSVPAVLITGASRFDAPFFGGTLVPFPNAILFGFGTDSNGRLELTAPLPEALPPGTELFLQCWTADGVTPAGFASTNGVMGTSP